MPQRLNRETLNLVTGHLLSPTWIEPDIGIVHLGLGNFHRAHQALYTEEAMVLERGNWGICGVTLQGSTEKRDVLRDQDGLYTIIQRDTEGERSIVLRALREIIALPHDLETLKDRLDNPTVKIVSLTVTEKGYCRNTGTGQVDLSHSGILHDLLHPDSPTTAPGLILSALQSRREKGLPPFTVLSCDNLPQNGEALRAVLLGLADALENVSAAHSGLARWIEQNVTCPSTMVDRIVPATTDADRKAALQSLGVVDNLPVSCETFRQWVVEDRFVGGRPAWEKVGVQMVEDVTPFERAKLRMLNGSHSTLACLSLLAGFDTVDQAISHPSLHRLIYSMMTDEIIPTLSGDHSPDLFAYRDVLLTRFSNSTVKHRVVQIATDGSQKIPHRILSTIDDLITEGKSFPLLAFAVAGWMTSLRGYSDDGQQYQISDPLASQLEALSRSNSRNPGGLLQGILQITDIIPLTLRSSSAFQHEVLTALTVLRKGTLQALENLAI